MPLFLPFIQVPSYHFSLCLLPTLPHTSLPLILAWDLQFICGAPRLPYRPLYTASLLAATSPVTQRVYRGSVFPHRARTTTAHAAAAAHPALPPHTCGSRSDRVPCLTYLPHYCAVPQYYLLTLPPSRRHPKPFLLPLLPLHIPPHAPPSSFPFPFYLRQFTFCPTPARTHTFSPPHTHLPALLPSPLPH